MIFNINIGNICHQYWRRRVILVNIISSISKPNTLLLRYFRIDSYLKPWYEQYDLFFYIKLVDCLLVSCLLERSIYYLY